MRASDRSVRAPGFPDDDGSVPPDVAAALAAYDQDPGGLHTAILAALQHARLLVPVVAVPGDRERDHQGREVEKSSEMATVLMRGRDGRVALLAFTGTEPLRRWDPAARPVPVPAADAARAAVQDGAEALVIDVAGPVTVALEGEDLRALADGFRITDLAGRAAWVRRAPPPHD